MENIPSWGHLELGQRYQGRRNRKKQQPVVMGLVTEQSDACWCQGLRQQGPDLGRSGVRGALQLVVSVVRVPTDDHLIPYSSEGKQRCAWVKFATRSRLVAAVKL